MLFGGGGTCVCGGGGGKGERWRDGGREGEAERLCVSGWVCVLVYVTEQICMNFLILCMLV